MKLTRVTITGADNGVSPHALSDLSREYPFVEWGILFSKKRYGEPRYPSTIWLGELAKSNAWERVSFHLCGEFARRSMGGDIDSRPIDAKRIQLNGFSDYVLPMLLCAERNPATEFILQCNTLEAVERAEWFVKVEGLKNVTALWDLSGGEGKQIENWPLPLGPLRIGYAGGLNETNIVRIAEKIIGAREPHDFWLDLESGARTDNKFDLDKVRRILELVKPFVRRPESPP